MTTVDATLADRTLSRRQVLSTISFLGLLGASGVVVWSNLLFFKPRVTYGEPSRFRIGRPEAFPMGTRLPLGRQRVTIVRNENGLAAISNTCTHLGCVIATTEIGFNCPCHGSRFDPDGTVLGGPAPRPLPWYQLNVSPSGEIEVDTSVEVAQGSYLKV